MTKKPKPPKNADFSQLAKSIVEAATSNTDEPPEGAAVKLKRSGGSKGGRARAQKLTAEQRSAIAKMAARKRWSKDS